ncbi:metallophosphoesterase [Mesorhizobium sp. M1380]|uniref:metallophosphoesterase n=1 Tax=Mesorhizobium sp. M1380 TaxID=2957093 RepID=UPI00333D8B7B
MESTSATFLYVTDAHIAYAGTTLERDDRKTMVAGLPPQTRELALRQVFERLAERLKREDRCLDGIIFSGDAQDRGRQGGHELLLDLLLNSFGPFGITPERIVATPGNHDVDRKYDPGTARRYKDFCTTWRDRGCVVPWLDGIEEADSAVPHILVDCSNRWANLSDKLEQLVPRGRSSSRAARHRVVTPPATGRRNRQGKRSQSAQATRRTRSL